MSFHWVWGQKMKEKGGRKEKRERKRGKREGKRGKREGKRGKREGERDDLHLSTKKNLTNTNRNPYKKS